VCVFVCVYVCVFGCVLLCFHVFICDCRVFACVLLNGICTAEELFEEERTRRLYLSSVKDISIVKTDGSADSHQGSSAKSNRSWLKRAMSKRRWTRKLGAIFFGWEWKKVRNNRNSKGAIQVEKFKK